jgi:hypothetical protein
VETHEHGNVAVGVVARCPHTGRGPFLWEDIRALDTCIQSTNGECRATRDRQSRSGGTASDVMYVRRGVGLGRVIEAEVELQYVVHPID